MSELHPDSIVIEPELSDSDESTISECTITLDELQGKPKLTAREKQIIKKLTKKCEPSEKQKAHTEKMRQKAYEKARERRRIEAEYPLIKKELDELKAKLEVHTSAKNSRDPNSTKPIEVPQIKIEPTVNKIKNPQNMRKFQW